MKKIILFIAMMLAIVGVYAQGVNFCTRNDLKQKYYKVVIDSITSGTAPFDITFNGYHVPVDSMFAGYNVNNILTVRDANNNEKSDTIYEANPHFVWNIGYHFSQFTNPMEGISFNRTGISIRCSFRDRYNFDINWYNVSNYTQIGYSTFYEPVPDSIWTCLEYRLDEAPIGIYAVRVRDTVHDMDTVVFVEITDPNATDTTTTDTTTTDTTITDTTSVDTTTTDTTILSLNSCDSIDNEIYPNPTKRFVNFTRPVEYVELLSAEGKLLMKMQGKVQHIDLSTLPSGTYFIRVGNTVKKILKI